MASQQAMVHPCNRTYVKGMPAWLLDDRAMCTLCCGTLEGLQGLMIHLVVQPLWQRRGHGTAVELTTGKVWHDRETWSNALWQWNN